jgi:hypothetical protein
MATFNEHNNQQLYDTTYKSKDTNTKAETTKAVTPPSKSYERD